MRVFGPTAFCLAAAANLAGCSNGLMGPQYPSAQTVVACAEQTVRVERGTQKSGRFAVSPTVSATPFSGPRALIQYRVDGAVPQLSMPYSEATGPEPMSLGHAADMYADIPAAERALGACSRPGSVAPAPAPAPKTRPLTASNNG